MCCIIYRPKDAKEISQHNLERIVKINPHGWGISYMKNGHLQVTKSLKMEDAIACIREIEAQNIEFLFHARWITHGDKIVENCHPYKLNSGVLFHNGKINVHCRDKKFSDTFFFSQKVNKFLKKGRSIKSIFNKFKTEIGPSRLAVMLNNGDIIKHGSWYEIDGCSYSKDNWRWGTTSNYNYGDDWDNYTGSKYSRKRGTQIYPQKAFEDLENAFKDLMDNSKSGHPFYTGLLTKLDNRELTIAARKYPKLAAEYISRVSK